MLDFFRLKTLLVWGVLLTVSSYKVDSKLIERGVNGGSDCVACTIVVALAEELSIVYNQTVDKSLENLCNFLPNGSIFQVACQQAVQEFGPIIIDG